MPSTRDIRRRIKSVKNTAQITKAMQLVAAAKMKKAQDQASNGRAYAELMNKILVSLNESAEEGVHPFFTPGSGGKALVLVIAAWRTLLYSSVRSLMICFALSVAFFMATIRLECSEARASSSIW